MVGTTIPGRGSRLILGATVPSTRRADLQKEIIRSMARGLPQRGDGGSHPITYHPTGGASSSEPFPQRSVAGLQHAAERTLAEVTGRYDQTRVDYDRSPTKPVLDGEPICEDHPVSFDAKNTGTPSPATCAVPTGTSSPAPLDTLRASPCVADGAPNRNPVNNPPAMVRGDPAARRRADAARPGVCWSRALS